MISQSAIEELESKIPLRMAVGSVLDIESVTINDSLFKISPPNNAPTVYISPLFQAGSCPYLKVYDIKNNKWLELGTILYMRNSPNLQHKEARSVGDNVTLIRIEEREEEITYLDSVLISFQDSKTGKTHTISHPNSKLSNSDGVYFELYQGETLEIDITDLLPEGATNLKLNVDGYYKPL